MDLELPPAIPPQVRFDDKPTRAWFVPAVKVDAVFAVSLPHVTTPILDIGTPGDLVGGAWLQQNPQDMTPIKASTRRYAFGHDVPPTIGTTSIRVHTTSATGNALAILLPEVTIVRHDTVPFLVGLPSQEQHHVTIYTHARTIAIGTAQTRIQCSIQDGHLVLPAGTPADRPRRPAKAYYTRSEMALAHRQFGHASVTPSPPRSLTTPSPPPTSPISRTFRKCAYPAKYTRTAHDTRASPCQTGR